MQIAITTYNTMTVCFVQDTAAGLSLVCVNEADIHLVNGAERSYVSCIDTRKQQVWSRAGPEQVPSRTAMGRVLMSQCWSTNVLVEQDKMTVTAIHREGGYCNECLLDCLKTRKPAASSLELRYLSSLELRYLSSKFSA